MRPRNKHGDPTTRRALRHLLDADAEVTDLESGIRITERTKDLNLHGCGMSTATPFPAGTRVHTQGQLRTRGNNSVRQGESTAD